MWELAERWQRCIAAQRLCQSSAHPRVGRDARAVATRRVPRAVELADVRQSIERDRDVATPREFDRHTFELGVHV